MEGQRNQEREGHCGNSPCMRGIMNISRILTNCYTMPLPACLPMGGEGIKIDSDFNRGKIPICNAEAKGD